MVIAQNPAFGNFTQKREDEGDENNVAVIDEKETVTQVYLEIPFFNNTNDKDGDGVIDALDIDSEDQDSDTDGDGISDFDETQNNLNPLSDDSDGDGILDGDDQDNKTYDHENKIYEIDSIYGNREARFELKVYELKYFLSKYDPATEFQNKQNISLIQTFLRLAFMEKRSTMPLSNSILKSCVLIMNRTTPIQKTLMSVKPYKLD